MENGPLLGVGSAGLYHRFRISLKSKPGFVVDLMRYLRAPRSIWLLAEKRLKERYLWREKLRGKADSRFIQNGLEFRAFSH